ncbi:beta strand repeat-containing protein, partial [Methanobrevibacter cuticularis]|uniref:beta strand repeat-containing protein n=1 Tax=Methanobrevibacter cuticularis TaxID=47311 RepID=UPI000A6D9C32
MNKFKKTSFWMILFLLLALLVMVSLSNSFAADTNITNSTAGGLKNAVNQSANNDRIILSDGTYTGDNNTDIVINKNLTITGKTKANTIIDLVGVNRLFTINPGSNLILANLTLQNAYMENGSSLINNTGYLTIENVNVINNAVIENSTSGFLIYNYKDLTVLNCTFNNNRGYSWFIVSAPINSEISNLNIINSTFTNCSSSYAGLVGVGTSSPGVNCIVNIIGSNFTSNNASSGVAHNIYVEDNSTVEFNIYDSNYSYNSAAYGGAIVITSGDNTTVTLNIYRSNFTGNNANRTTYGAGGVISMDQTYSKYSSYNLYIANSNFVGNNASYGGVIRTIHDISNYSNNNSLVISNSTFINNTATYGAVIFDTEDPNIEIIDSIFDGNKASNSVLHISTNSNNVANIKIARSIFTNSMVRFIFINTSTNGTVNVDILNSSFVNNSGGAISINAGSNGTVSADIVGNIFVGNSNAYGAIRVNTPNVKVNYNVFFNQTIPISSNDTSNNVNADYNYYGYNGIPTLTNVVVNSYYVLGITNISDLSANYNVGDLLRFNYTVYLNGSNDSSGSDLLPSMNGVYWNGTFFKEFGLNNSGIIEVPIQSIADPNVVFKNLNGTIIGSGIFTLTGTISKGNITNITIDQLIIVNNSVADITLHINPNIGGLSPITFNVTIGGQSQNVTFVNGTGIFTGFNYGQLGNQSLPVSFASTDDYNPVSTNLNTSFKDNVNLDITADDVIYGDNLTVVINATTPNGTAIIDGVYEVIINNITYNVTFTNGVGRVNITGLDANEYTYTIVFKANSNYTESNNNVNFIVSKSGTIINVDLPTDAVYGENSTIAGNITDANGNLINGTYNITVTINGIEYNVTVIDGLWSLTIPNTKSGLSNIDISFFGDNNYNNATIATNYTVNP